MMIGNSPAIDSYYILERLLQIRILKLALYNKEIYLKLNNTPDTEH